jgi:predicted nucleic acid-binding Zn ribbon protein
MPQGKKPGDQGDHTFCEMILSGSVTMTHAVKKNATQRQLLRPQHFTLIQYLHYKPEVRGFDSRLCHWNFLMT